jgi:hypothetical protein
VDRRLVPLNGILDLATADGLNPAPLAAEGWRVVGLEIPITTEQGTIVIDLVLFNARIGHVLGSSLNLAPILSRSRGAS